MYGSTLAVASLLAGCGGGAGNLAPGVSAPATAQSVARQTRLNADWHSAPYKSLYSFAGPTGDGSDPTSSLISYGGELYGTTAAGGGPDSDGTIFKISTAGAEKAVYSFGNGSDGSQPLGDLTPVWNTFYGTTYAGGVNNAGTVYAFNASSGKESVIYTFGTNGSTDASAPAGGVTLVGDDLFGTSTAGGANNEGTIFKINLAKKTESVVYSFGSTPTDGTVPYAGLTAVGPYLYGTTSNGGANGAGAVFKINAFTGAESIVYSFGASATDGSLPAAGLVLDGNMLYGTTIAGGASGDGTIYSINPFSGKETVLHSFAGAPADGSEGCIPGGGVDRSRSHHHHSFWHYNGTLYGTTCSGGANGNGTIFSFAIGSKTEKVLYSFGASPDGSSPEADVTQIGNTLYGTASGGGANGLGTVFSYTL
jgi:uncharacterized repeat protein (TIGR03803 family)